MDKIIVFGDVMLDKYIYSKAKKINSETPNIVFEFIKNEFKLGGSGNVAKNLSLLNFEVFFLSDLGTKSDNSKILNNLLDKFNVNYSYSINSQKNLTIKNRYMCLQNQVFRIDNEDDTDISSEMESMILTNFKNIINSNNIKYLIVSDYNKGLVTEYLCTQIILLCNKNNIKVFIDPKLKNCMKYNNSFLLKPNRNEFINICQQLNIKIDNDIFNVANLQLVYKKLNLEYLVVTLDKDGIILYNDNKIQKINTKIENNILDITGAGDTVLCSIVYYYNIINNMTQSVINANKIGSYSVSHLGCLDLNIPLFDRILTNKKLLSIDEINILDRSKKIIFTNGCFDILHSGHIQYLQKSKNLGDILIVGLNSDESVKKNKGPSRPINNQQERYLVLSSLPFIDYIIIFEEKNPYKLISKLIPNILVKGADYKLEEVIGRNLVEKVVLMDVKKGFSTSNIINRIVSSSSSNSFPSYTLSN